MKKSILETALQDWKSWRKYPAVEGILVQYTVNTYTNKILQLTAARFLSIRVSFLLRIFCRLKSQDEGPAKLVTVRNFPPVLIRVPLISFTPMFVIFHL